MTKDVDLLHRITADTSVMGGKPCIRGKRITVEHVVRWFAAGSSEDELLDQFPFLDKEDVQAALLYASRLTALTRMSGDALAKATQLDDAAAG